MDVVVLAFLLFWVRNCNLIRYPYSSIATHCAIKALYKRSFFLINLVLCVHREGIISDDEAWFMICTSFVSQHYYYRRCNGPASDDFDYARNNIYRITNATQVNVSYVRASPPFHASTPSSLILSKNCLIIVKPMEGNPVLSFDHFNQIGGCMPT
jgi:hypothetical protein